MSRRGLVGKLPCRDDFVRHALDGAGGSFDRWMQRAVEALVAAKLEVPPEGVRALLAFADEPEAVVALLAPSTDRVGRRFPIAFFERVPLDVIGDAFSALPVAAEPFLSAAEALACDAATLPLEAVIARLASLPGVDADAMSRARGICARTLASERAGDFEARVFAAPAAERAYAYHTLLVAAGQVSGRFPERPGPSLECPIAIDVDQFAYLELLRRVLGWPERLPSVLWREEPSPRMVVSLGAPTERLLAEVAGSGGSRHVWPLTTAVEEARREADARVGKHLGGLAADATLEALLAAISRLAPDYVS